MNVQKILILYLSVLLFSTIGAALATHFLPLYGYTSFVPATTESGMVVWYELIAFHVFFASLNLIYFLLFNTEFRQKNGSELIVFTPIFLLFLLSPIQIPLVFSIIASTFAYFYIKNSLQKPQETFYFMIENLCLFVFQGVLYIIISDVFIMYPSFVPKPENAYLYRNEWVITGVFNIIFGIFIIKIAAQFLYKFYKNWVA